MSTPRTDPLAGYTCEQIHAGLSNVKCAKCGEVIPAKPRRQSLADRPIWVGAAPRRKPAQPVNHGLHIGLCILTLGVWVIPYAVILVLRGLQQSSYRRHQDTRDG